MLYLFLPLHQHSDSGFGATADAFKEAADSLARRRKKRATLHQHLPVNFLYRHSIELYLKSIIIIVHRSLQLPFGTAPHDGEPAILVDNRWRPMFQVHSVAQLYSYFRRVLRDQSATIATRCKTDWQAVPPGLDGCIELIEKQDGGSTYFRYPVTRDRQRDQQKSSFRQEDPLRLLMSAHKRTKPLKACVLVDSADNVQSTFVLEEDPLPGVTPALKKAAELLSCACIGLRVELADGL